MIRLSTNQVHERGVQYIRDAQVAVADTQAQIGGGKRILDPSDDPSGSARLVELQHQIAATAQFQENVNLARGRLAIEDSTLDEFGNLLKRAQELALQGNNAPLTNADRRAVAQELRQIRNQAVQLANTKDGAGDFLFSGYKAQTTPVGQSGSAAVYQGDSGQRFLQIGPTRLVAVDDPGDEVFFAIRNGNGRFVTEAATTNTGSAVIGPGSVADPAAFDGHGYQVVFTSANTYTVQDLTAGTPPGPPQPWSPGDGLAFAGMEIPLNGTPAVGDSFSVVPATAQDVFTTFDRVIAALESPTSTEASVTAFHQALSNGIADFEQAANHLLEVRGRVGSRLNALDAQEEANSDFSLRMQEVRGGIEDTDYAAAASRLQQELLALQAAQQSFAKIQGLSLFDYLR